MARRQCAGRGRADQATGKSGRPPPGRGVKAEEAQAGPGRCARAGDQDKTPELRGGGGARGANSEAWVNRPRPQSPTTCAQLAGELWRLQLDTMHAPKLPALSLTVAAFMAVIGLPLRAATEQSAVMVRETPPISASGLQVWERGGDGVLANTTITAPAADAQTEALRARAGCPHAPALAQAAAQHGLPLALVLAVVDAESRCRHAGVISPKGAIGLMQVMPATAARFGASNPWDVTQNIAAGTAYLAWLRDRFAGDQTRMIAAYNAGEGAVERHNGIPPYAETRAYVRRVLARMPEFAGQSQPQPPPAPIVAVISASAPAHPSAPSDDGATSSIPSAHNRSIAED
jgi:soluble lytic murein transglycosylase-like protein